MQKLIMFWFSLTVHISAFGQFKSLHFSQYGTEEGLPATEVYHVVQDHEGYLWFATDRGISRFDGYEFKNYTTEDGLTDNTIIRFFIDDKQRIWCVTLNKQLCYIEEGKVFPYPLNDALAAEGLLKRTTVYSNVVVDTHDQLYLEMHALVLKAGESSSTLFESNGSGGELKILAINADLHVKQLTFPTPMLNGAVLERIQLFDRTGTFQKEHVVAPDQHPKESTFFSTAHAHKHYIPYGKGFFCIDKDTVIFKALSASPISLYVSPSGDLWAGLNKGGALLLDLNTLEIRQQYLEGYTVTSVLQDKEKGLWFTTLEGGVFYAPSAKHYQVNPKLLKGENIRTLAINTKGLMVIGFENGGPMQWVDKQVVKDGFPIDRILHLSFLSDDQLLCNCRKTRIYNLKTGGVDQLINYHAFSAYQYNNALYIDNYRFEKRKGRWEISANYDLDIVPRAMYLVPSDTLYLVGWEGSYRIVGEQITPLKEINPLFDRRFNDVKGINNRVFFASSTIGVLMLENGKLTQIGRDEGLTSNIVTCITLEDEHHVWVGTNKGLNYIDLTKQPIAITAITAQDGLVSDEVTNIKLFQDTIWVGTKHGLSYFNKADGFLQQIQPTVQLTGVWVNDQEIPHPSNHFELSADENQLTVRYTALLFRAKGTLTYKYRLKGYSDRWRTTQERQLTFSALDDGDYEMEIVAGYRGRWSANPLTIAFRIKPYFWETWWFILVVASLVVLLMYGLYRWRLREAQGKIQLEQKVIELRNEALKAQINPHFAFNSLNSIQKLISEENSKASEIYLAKFGSLLRLVLEHSNQKLIRIADEIQLLETYLELEKLRFKDKLRYQFTIEKEIDIHDYFMPPLLLQPFIENALLHGILPKASGGNINITFKEKGTDQLVCMIVDDGLGINHRKQHKLHGSTSRGLAISKERVESLTSLYKMPCTITITDRKEIDHTVTGTAVEISLPKIYTI